MNVLKSVMIFSTFRMKYLGILFDQNISFNSDVSYLRKCCYAELRKISRITPLIDKDCCSAMRIAHFVEARLLHAIAFLMV